MLVYDDENLLFQTTAEFPIHIWVFFLNGKKMNRLAPNITLYKWQGNNKLN
jgi:hypothetical protein